MTAADQRTILFVFRDPGRVRYFEPALELLAERGHRLHLAIEKYRERLPGQFAVLEGLAARHPNVTYGHGGKRRDEWAKPASDLRLALDWLHYLKPAFDDAPDFRARAERDAPSRVVRTLRAWPSWSRAAAERMLLRAERSLPLDPRAVALIAKRQPDAVLVTPLVWFGGPQTDWIRAARAAGVPTAGCVFSWDNLTSKGRLLAQPDVLTVWNGAQRREAVELHGMPHHQVAVTGAQSWDHWFDWSPSRSRVGFCAEAGLPADRPYVLYLQSSGYVGGEPEFVREWIEHLRRAGPPEVRDAAVLIRPHPQVVADDWESSGVLDLPAVAVWPRRGRAPLDADSRRDYFDTMHHAAAVVGVNTSAFIEAAILGRPCLTLTMERFRKGQTGTVHFHHLRAQNGGPVIEATGFDEHADQLGAVMQAPLPDQSASAFVESFVRPLGLDVPAAPRLVATIEELCARPAPVPTRTTVPDRALRAAVRRLCSSR